MTAAARPVGVDADLPKPADDGLFGPDSVTWRVLVSPASSIGTATAVLAQMLHPRVARLLAQASTFERNPTLRAELTAQYGTTITFGDTAAAERAGAALRRLHSRMKAVDVDTGKEYTADEPDLLMWVHVTIPWAMLRALDRWGPALTPAEQDRFVNEQRTAARLVGLDPETVPGTVADLQASIDSMLPKLAYTEAAGRIRAIMVPRTVPRSGTELVTRLVQLGAADLLPREMRELYGYWWGPLQRGLLGVATNGIVRAAAKKAPYERMVPKMREQATVHAFGARALRINRELRSKDAATSAAGLEDRPAAD
jgi:uncharacterized protein (DUF2236 family)